MPTRTLDQDIVAARQEVQAWTGQTDSSDEDLTDTVCEQMKRELGWDLCTNWNAGAGVFDARWEHKGGAADERGDRFSADILEHARLLACAAALSLMKMERV